MPVVTSKDDAKPPEESHRSVSLSPPYRQVGDHCVGRRVTLKCNPGREIESKGTNDGVVPANDAQRNRVQQIVHNESGPARPLRTVDRPSSESARASLPTPEARRACGPRPRHRCADEAALERSCPIPSPGCDRGFNACRDGSPCRASSRRSPLLTRLRGTAFRDGQRSVQSLEVRLGVDDRTSRCFEIRVGLPGLCGRFLKAAMCLGDHGGRGGRRSGAPCPPRSSGRGVWAFAPETKSRIVQRAGETTLTEGGSAVRVGERGVQRCFDVLLC